MSELSLKTHEDRCRRALRRKGFALRKSRRRDPAMPDHGGYMIVDPVWNAAVAGSSPIAYAISLEAVQAFLDGCASATTTVGR
jgi:hypothetical protein